MSTAQKIHIGISLAALVSSLVGLVLVLASQGDSSIGLIFSCTGIALGSGSVLYGTLFSLLASTPKDRHEQ